MEEYAPPNRRLQNEIARSPLEVDMWFHDNSNTDVYFLIKTGNIRIHMVVNHTTYPFRPPEFEKVHVNNFAYRDLIITPLMQEHYKGNCPCCESMLCMATQRWSPTTTLAEIVFEICDNLSIKRRIVEFICLNVLVRKYLVPDMNLVLREFL